MVSTFPDSKRQAVSKRFFYRVAWFSLVAMISGIPSLAQADLPSDQDRAAAYTQSYVILPAQERDPLAALDTNQDLRECAQALNELFLERGLYVIDPRAGFMLDERLRATGIIAERRLAETEEIFASRLLADVEVRFSLKEVRRGIPASTGLTIQVDIQCLSQDGRLITADALAGAGGSKSNKSVTIRAAAYAAGRRLLSRLAVAETSTGSRPLTLRVIVQFSTKATDRHHACPRRALLDAMHETADLVKENIITAKTIDCWIFLKEKEKDGEHWLAKVIETFAERCDQPVKEVLMKDNLILLKVIEPQPKGISPPTKEEEK